MATVQLIGVADGVATVQRDELPAVEMTWSLLHEAQRQDGTAGAVYRWLMAEYCRCEYEQRQGRPWTSPRRDVEEIARTLRAADASADAERLARRQQEQAHEERERRKEAARQDRYRVEDERMRTPADSPWWPILRSEIPAGVRFDTPRRNQGQIVEVSYGDFGASEADDDAPYMRVYDHSDRTCDLYRRR